ncbi:hypothetical protein P22_3786 [Propionispora sp. 2/2-37]|uniref:S-ribosylhomocysteine lyase n=1 Tax=Propionispora sp. 2/2-37 TaxID=1677858 RepID=UPI0006BB74B6|nr:S-ribosylhomocysteine lyase [Propionispora sp. 2/2-37]CUH97651.1 hypothetical protein P22_3786 [Propionispora sp. 2/2-37]
MLVSFPHMGDMNIVLKALFTGLGRQVITPPPISKQTLALGNIYAPEAVCLPFKVMLGNFIEALEQGADTLVTCGGIGPCRLGYYAEVQRSILYDLGYNFEMLVVEARLNDVVHALRRIAGPGCNLKKIYDAFCLAIGKMNALDTLRRKVYGIRPCESERGSADTVWRDAVREIDGADTLEKLHAVCHKADDRLQRISLRPGFKAVRIGIIGELYVMLEPYVNLDLERQLGNMGVEVFKTMQLSDYVQGHLFRKQKYLKKFRELATLAQPYLGHYVGGHALKSIAHTVSLAREEYDGMIHIFPFSCMPEVIAQNILPRVSQETGIPVLSLAFDEQSGEAGIMTRLEAFVDLLHYRRGRRQNNYD